MAVTYVRPTDGQDLTVASAFDPIDAINAGLTSHMRGLLTNGAERHTAANIDVATLTETTSVTNSPATQQDANDISAKVASAIMGGSGSMTTRYGSLASDANLTSLRTIAYGHTHDGTGSNGPKLLQANSHQTPDTDAGTTSLHHTLGTGAFQAAAGNHTHASYALASALASYSLIGHVHGSGSEAKITTGGIADFAVTGGGAAGSQIAVATIKRINIAEGYTTPLGSLTTTTLPITYQNGSGASVTASGTSPALTITGGTQQYALLYGDANGTLAWKYGATDPTSPPHVSADTGTYPLVEAWLHGQATLLASDLTQKTPYNVYGAGGAGGGADLSAKPFITIGNDGTLTNETDIFDLAAGLLTGTVNSKDRALWRVADGMQSNNQTDATNADYMSTVVTGNVIGALQPGTVGGTLQLSVGSGSAPIFVQTNGRKQVADSTHNAQSATPVVTAGTYQYIARLASAGRYFTGLVNAVGTALAANDVLLAQVYWDGSAWWLSGRGGAYYPIMPRINGASYSPFRDTNGQTNVSALATGAAVQILPGAPVITFNLPVAGLVAEMFYAANCQAPASLLSDVRLYPMASNGAAVALTTIGGATSYCQWNLQPASSIVPGANFVKVAGLPAGPVNFGLGYYSATGGGAYNFIGATCRVDITAAA